MTRRLAVSLLLLSLASPLAAGGQPADGGGPQAQGAPLRVGATSVPHAELLRAVQPELKAQGVSLEIRVYEDYGLPNIDVARGALDANFFQTEPYLWRWRAAHMRPLVVVGRVHVEPMGLYSKKLRDLAKVRDGAVVFVPQDPSNLGRALALLRHAGLIEVDERRGLDAILGDITANPHKLRFKQLPPDRLAEQLGSADLVVLNGNFALQAKLPADYALYREGPDSPFPNVVVTREELQNDSRIKALVAALRGATARKLLLEKYAGTAVPAD